MQRRWLRATGVVVFFVAGSVVYTWPLAATLGSGYAHLKADPSLLEEADSYLTTWMLAWGAHALVAQPLAVFDANIFYPLRHALAFSEHMLGAAIVMLPAEALAGNPVLVHNLLVLLSYVVLGVGGTALCAELGCATPGALVGGALVAFGPARLGYVAHVHLLASHWMPLTLLALHRFLVTRRPLAGAAFAGALLLQSLTAVYHAYYFGVAVGAFIVLHAAFRLPAARGAHVRAIGWAALAAILVAPTFLPYLDVRDRFALGRNWFETWYFSAVADNFIGNLRDPLGWLGSRFVMDGAVPLWGVGLGTAALALVGAVAGARPAAGGRRVGLFYFAFALAVALVSLGPSMRLSYGLATGIPGPYALLEKVVPGFDALRAPARASISAFVALGILAGLGADALVARIRPLAARAAIGAALAVVVVADCWHPPFFVKPVEWNPDGDPVHRWLGRQAGPVAVVELPLGSPPTVAGYMVQSSEHWQRLVNGYSGFDPAGVYLREVLFRFPDARSLRLLHDLDVRWVVAHPGGPRRLCELPARLLAPYLRTVLRDGDDCVMAVDGAPPLPARPAERPVALAGARLTGSGGEDASAAADGDLATHWTEEVTATKAGWLQVDLPEPHVISRIVLRLGRHFGDYPRQYRLETSADGATWIAVAPDTVGPAPLVSARADPDDLRVELELPPTATRHLRIVRPAATPQSPWGLFSNWITWGVHELELYEPAS